jgi:shikimate dehydrogenase
MDIPQQISGSTRLIALVGDPIGAVRSPQLLNGLFARERRDAVCFALHVPTEALATVFAGLKAIRNLDGILVTMPHKRAALDLVDALHDTAACVGALSIVRREPGDRWVAANFDGLGCVLGMRWDGIDPGGRRVLLVGAGGAGRAIAFAVAQAGGSTLTISDHDEAAARRLAEAVRIAVPQCRTRPGVADPRGHDIVINATPLGMQASDPLPIDPNRLDEGAAVVDIVTKSDPTPLRVEAGRRGCRVQGGSAMHEGQAVYAARFLGSNYWPEGREMLAVEMPFATFASGPYAPLTAR